MSSYFISMYIIYHIFPYMFQLGAFMPKTSTFITKRYSKSKLRNIDLNTLEQNLKFLMEKEKIYKDEKMNLEILAGKLNVTSHQLSEYLNAFLSLSFADYLHKVQTEEAKRILIENTEISVSRVGVEAGFHSDAAFFTVFKKETGLSPREFRSRHKSAK